VTIFILLLSPPVVAGLLALVVRPYRAAVGWVNAALSLVSLVATLALWSRVLAGEVPTTGPGEFLRADALSTLLAFSVSLVSALSAWLGPGLGADDGYDRAQARRFRVFANLFTFTMLFAVTTNNVGFMWVAIEATTITSAVLIPLHVSKASVEAAWKYILIASVGIALAFAGTVLAYFDFVNVAGRHAVALNWTVLNAAAPSLHADVVKLAFVFLLVGYGTKAGLAPMHTWLPDAHSEAPASLSAMMSGVLLAVALYAVMRWAAVTRAAVGDGFAEGFLLALGLLSLAIAAFSLVVQRNYKRLLAYSSIEHTGLMCVGLALGPLGTFAAMLHLLSHALGKPVLFFLSGRVLQRYGSTEIGRVAGLMKVMPWTGTFFAAGVLGIAGLPPSGIFISEFALFRAGFAAGQWWTMGLVLTLLVVAFIGVLSHLNRMLYGPPSPEVRVGEAAGWSLVPLALCLTALVVLGVIIPAPLEGLVAQIATTTGE
jgi:hydrogenase-4 component F